MNTPSTSFNLTLGTTGNSTLDALVNNSSFQQVINSNATITITGNVNAATADLVINGTINVGNSGNNNTSYMNIQGIHDVYFNVATSINPAGHALNTGNGAWAGRKRCFR